MKTPIARPFTILFFPALSLNRDVRAICGEDCVCDYHDDYQDYERVHLCIPCYSPNEKSGCRQSRQALPSMPLREPSRASLSMSAIHTSRAMRHSLRLGGVIPFRFGHFASGAIISAGHVHVQRRLRHPLRRPRLRHGDCERMDNPWDHTMAMKTLV